MKIFVDIILLGCNQDLIFTLFNINVTNFIIVNDLYYFVIVELYELSKITQNIIILKYVNVILLY